MTSEKGNIRFGADIGGTFTDIALDYTAPEQKQRQFPGQEPVQGIRHGGHR